LTVCPQGSYIFCVHLNTLVIILLTFLLALILPTNNAQYFHLLLFTFVDALTFQLAYSAFTNIR
jgi:hypothetical protein